MAKDASFDIVSKVDMQEVVNAVDQALREISTRYDLKDSNTEINLDKEKRMIKITSADDYKVRASNDVLKNKMVKRGIPLKALNEKEPYESGLNKTVMEIAIQDGIPQEKAKEIVKAVKEAKLKKVQASIQGDVVRISGPKRDDLQEAISLLKEKDFGIDMQFDNYR
ncbi:MAG TPA: YajQ family cyclic di-GMP-binding protein [Firmicutes bacterium]|nr:YajQ family cyclic di-GMP-binding protein [Bacillota bacterium]